MNIKSLFKYTLIVLSVFAYSSTLNAKDYKVKGTVFDADGEKVGEMALNPNAPNHPKADG